LLARGLAVALVVLLGVVPERQQQLRDAGIGSFCSTWPPPRWLGDGAVVGFPFLDDAIVLLAAGGAVVLPEVDVAAVDGDDRVSAGFVGALWTRRGMGSFGKTV